MRPGLAAAVLLTLTSSGCDLFTGPGPEPTTVEVRPGFVSFDAIGDVRTVTAEVRDQHGALIEGVEVSWTSSATSVAEVAPDGRVTARGNGIATLMATVGAISGDAAVSVQQLPGLLEIVEGDGQEAPAGTLLPRQIRVRVADRMGTPMQGVSVVFTVIEGGGTVSPRTVVTQADGIAPTNWRVGSDWDVPQRVRVGVTGAARLAATFLAVATPREFEPEGFEIAVEFLTAVPLVVRDAFEDAVARWGEVIVEKLVPFAVDLPPQACDNPQRIVRAVDDLHLLVSVVPIDGPGGTLAQARPCVLREGNFLPAAGLIRLDQADVDRLAVQGQLYDVVLHEIGHVLGIGTLWQDLGLLRNPSLPANPGADTHFDGQRAIDAFDAVGGTGYTAGAKVPVENELGGQGTRDSHWRRSVFSDELMVGFIGDAGSSLSRVTIASLADLGYAVDEAVADPYTLPLARTSPAPLAPEEDTDRIDLHGDVLSGPLLVVDRLGRVVQILPPRP